MRGVAILTSLFPPSVGGIQTQTLALARGLAELGTEVRAVHRGRRSAPLLLARGTLRLGGRRRPGGEDRERQRRERAARLIMELAFRGAVDPQGIAGARDERRGRREREARPGRELAGSRRRD